MKLLSNKKTKEDSQTTKEKLVPKNPPKKGLLHSVLGAFVGMFIGLIPSIISILFFSTTYPFLFVTIPLCTCLFMVLFNRPEIKNGIILFAAFSIIGVFFTEIIYVAYLYAYSANYSLWTIFGLFFYMFFDVSVWEALKGEPIYTYIFIVLGVAIAWEVFFWPKKSTETEKTAAPAEADVKIAKDTKSKTTKQKMEETKAKEFNEAAEPEAFIADPSLIKNNDFSGETFEFEFEFDESDDSQDK